MFGVAFPEKKLIRANRYAGLVVAKNHTANCQCILPTESPLSGQKLGEAFVSTVAVHVKMNHQDCVLVWRKIKIKIGLS